VKIPKRLDQNVQDVSSSTISADFADEKANVDLDSLQKLKARFMLWLKDGQVCTILCENKCICCY